MSPQPDCDEARNRFLSRLDSELAADEAAALEAHLVACADCRDEAGELAALHRDLCLDAARDGDDAEAGIRSILDAVRAKGDARAAAPPAAEIHRTPSPRPARKRESVPRRRVWVPTLVAASILAGAVTLLTLSVKDGRPPVRQPSTGADSPPLIARAGPESPATPPSGDQPLEAPVPRTVPASPTPPDAPSPVATVPTAAAVPTTATAAAPEAGPVTPPAPPLPSGVVPQPPDPRPAGTPTGPPAATVAAGPVIARVDAVRGSAFLVLGAERVTPPAGAEIRAGHGLETRGGGSRLAVRHPDGTRVELRGETSVRQVAYARPGAGAGKGWTLTAGTLVAEVSRQPADAPFVVRTPTADATVLGTSFRIECSADATQLEVREGKVKLTRSSDRASITVPAGHFAVATPAKGESLVARASRVESGLLALYAFDEREGDTVHDAVESRAPLDLRVGNPEAVRWRPHGLLIQGNAQIGSINPATALANAMRQKHELTLEAWIRPTPVAQQGPTGLLLLAGCSLHQIAMLGYGGADAPAAQIRGFLRTAETEGDAKSWLVVAERPGEPRLAHVVFTRASGGAAHLYVDGVERAAGRIPGEIPLCTVPHRLVLGEGPGGAGPWKGEMHLASIYGRALAPDEVRRNFLAGCGGLACTARH